MPSFRGMAAGMATLGRSEAAVDQQSRCRRLQPELFTPEANAIHQLFSASWKPS